MLGLGLGLGLEPTGLGLGLGLGLSGLDYITAYTQDWHFPLFPEISLYIKIFSTLPAL